MADHMIPNFIYPNWVKDQTFVPRLLILTADPGAETARHVALLRRIAEKRVRTLTAQFTPAALWISGIAGAPHAVELTLQHGPDLAVQILHRLGVRRIDVVVSSHPAHAMEYFLQSSRIPVDVAFTEVAMVEGEADLPRWIFSAERRVAANRALARQINAAAPQLSVMASYVPEPEAPVRYRVNPPPLRPGEPLKVLIPALSSNTMNVKTVGETLRALSRRNAPVEIYGLWDPRDDRSLSDVRGMNNLGIWGQVNLNSLICILRPHVAWLPYSVSRGYDYLLSDVMHQGLPVLISDVGAAPERLVGRDKTWVMPVATSGAELASFLSELWKNGISSPSRTPEPAELPLALQNYYPDIYTAPVMADTPAP